MLGGEPTRLLRPTRWAPLLLPALQFQSFRSKSLQSFLSFSFFTYSKIEEIQVFAKSRIPVCWEGSLLGYCGRPAGRHFCFQLFNFNRFGPNHSRVFFHFRFSLIQKLRRYKFLRSPVSRSVGRAAYSVTAADPLGATFASSSSISIVSVQITPEFSFI